MKVTYRQSGGIAGRIDGCELDTELLSAPDSEKLRDLVAGAGFSGSFERFSSKGRDLMVYTIELDSEEGRFRVSFDEMSVPASYGPLIEFLQERAEWRPPR